MKRRGIILAGGTGSRLHPSTISVSKQLMPVFDKPMIYYPLCVLMEADMNEVLIITTPHDNAAFRNLLGDGSKLGMRIEYAVQPSPDGLAQALIIAESFLMGGPSALVLGDNLFFGGEFLGSLQKATKRKAGATIFGYHVNNPRDYGVVGFDDDKKAISLEEKPKKPASNYAITGLYFYDFNAPAMAKEVEPSDRGELEITTLNAMYLEQKSLEVELLGQGTTWLDTGTHRSLLQAAQFVGIVEERQGRRISCPEEVAWRKGWITDDQLLELADPLVKSGYGKFLKGLLIG